MAQNGQDNLNDFNQTPDLASSDNFDQNQNVSQILNQDEIDSLLNSGDGTDTQTGVHALLNTTTVSYERLPMLEIVLTV